MPLDDTGMYIDFELSKDLQINQTTEFTDMITFEQGQEKQINSTKTSGTTSTDQSLHYDSGLLSKFKTLLWYDTGEEEISGVSCKLVRVPKMQSPSNSKGTCNSIFH